MSTSAPELSHAGRSRRAPAPTLSSPRLVAVLTALAVAALLLFLTRVLFLHPDRFSGDFQNDAWYIRHQAATLRDAHVPSLFLTAETAAFYPIFAFYGGTLFVLAGALSLVTGGPGSSAEASVYLLALASAYGGWLWLARQAGVRGWAAHAPAVVYVTAPYVITNIYAREDLVETVAAAAIPLLVAAAISVARADRLRAGPAAALAVATIVFTGSHNLTLLYGLTFLVLVTAVVLAAIPPARHLVTRRGVLRVLAVIGPALAVNAWFLLPDIAYSHQTAIAQRIDEARALLRTPAHEFTLGHLLTPTRPDVAGAAGYTLPVLALAWALLAAATARPHRRAPWLRMLVVMVVLVAATVVLMGHAGVLARLPSPWPLIQSGGRLDTFALFALCGALIAALALVGRPRRWLAGSLAIVLVAGVVMAAHQIDQKRLGVSFSSPSLDGIVTYGLGDYADGVLPVIRVPKTENAAVLLHDSTRREAQLATANGSPGDMFLTNLMAPASMVDVEGAHPVGVWEVIDSPAWHPRRFLVLEIDRGAEGTRHTVVIRPARTLPIVAGKVISLLGLAGLAGLAVALTRGARRRARERRPPPRSAAA